MRRVLFILFVMTLAAAMPLSSSCASEASPNTAADAPFMEGDIAAEPMEPVPVELEDVDLTSWDESDAVSEECVPEFGSEMSAPETAIDTRDLQEIDILEEANQTEPGGASAVPDALVLGRKEKYQLGAGDAYASSNPKIASVSGTGMINAKKKGKAVITVTAGGDVVGACTVIVRAAPKRISLPKRGAVLIGQSIILTPKVKGGASGKITWKSSNNSIATVDGNGFVTGIRTGKVKITAKTYNKKKATCTVTVRSPNEPTSVSFPVNTLYIGNGESVQLQPILNYGAEATFRYTTSDKSVVSVNQEGVVSGRTAGRSAQITVRTQNGKSAKLQVEVLRAPDELYLDDPSGDALVVGGTLQMTASLPENAASQITWRSSSPEVAVVSEERPFTAGIGSSITVTGVGIGSATITASTFNGREVSWNIEVEKAVEPAIEDTDSEETDVRDTGALLKLLFIGNSHTFFNDLPGMVRDLAVENGYACQVTKLAESGWSLLQHVNEPNTEYVILSGGFDYVILQDRANPFNREDFTSAVLTLNALIRQTGAIPVLYESWTNKDAANKQAELDAAHYEMAEKIGAILVPVGEYWRDNAHIHSGIDMYAGDGIHATKAGSQFAAGMIWDMIYSYLQG